MPDNFNTCDRPDGIRVTTADTTPDVLLEKLVAGDNITLNLLNAGGDEQIEIVGTGGGGGSLSGALVNATTNLSVVNNTLTIIDWNQEIFDTDGFHDNSTNPSRLTIPADVSRVQITAGNVWDSNATGRRECRILLDGALITAPRASFTALPPAGANFCVFSFVTAVIDVAEANYFEMQVLQDSTGNLDFLRTQAFFQLVVIE
jgi:hypothetical protein